VPDDPQLEALKLPPHSLEAEQSVLGGLLLDNEAADRVGDIVSKTISTAKPTATSSATSINSAAKASRRR
jgi:hypothetical protein